MRDGKVPENIFMPTFAKTLVKVIAQWLVVKFLWLEMTKSKDFQRTTVEAINFIAIDMLYNYSYTICI